MRIISGEFKGRKLNSLKGNATRPTTDRVRESIFNILATHIVNVSVLDLFAGTGAFGLEALSRGAASAVFIDSSASAIKIIQKNITACKAETRGRGIRWDISKNLNCLQVKTQAYDLVFMDPPYNGKTIKPSLLNLHRSGSMEEDALIIVEHSPLEAIPEDILGLTVVDQRRYGNTLVSFLNFVV